MKIVIIILYLSFITGITLSQDVLSDMEKVRQAYNSASDLSMEVVYSVYSGNNRTPEKKVTGKYIKQQNRFFKKENEVITIQDGNYMVIVNNKDKWISVHEPLDVTGENNMNMGIDSMLTMYRSVKYEGMVNNRKKYSLEFEKKPGSLIQKMDMYINGTNFFVEKLAMYFLESNNNAGSGNQGKVIIEYKNINTEKISPGVFNTGKYIARTEKHFALKDEYKNFKLIILTD